MSQQITACRSERIRLDTDAVRFDNACSRLLGQSCDESLAAVVAFTSLNPATHLVSQFRSIQFLSLDLSCVDHHRVVLVADGGNVFLNLVTLP